jgi:hypothetical protein
MTRIYNKNFHSKVIQNIPKVDFWSENEPSGNPAVGLGPIVTCLFEASVQTTLTGVLVLRFEKNILKSKLPFPEP